MSKNMWDDRYSEPEYVYGTNPNEFFKQELDKLSPATILLPAEGEGRNAVYAAEHGWKVTAFDQSEEGMTKALRLATLRNVTIDYQLHDLATTEYPEGHFDVIALVFVHTPPQMRQTLHRKLMGFLKPGGTLILTGFSKEQLQFSSGGPKDATMLFSPDELREDFEDLLITSLQQQEVVIEEGEYHKGRASVVKMVGVLRESR